MVIVLFKVFEAGHHNEPPDRAECLRPDCVVVRPDSRLRDSVKLPKKAGFARDEHS